jgi:peptide/nickel transport system permease protein
MAQPAESVGIGRATRVAGGRSLVGRGSFVRRLLRIKLAAFGVAVIAVVAFCALFAGQLAPYAPNSIQTFRAELPSAAHPLGTDQIGRDQLSRLLYGARVSLIVSVCAATFAAIVGGALGLLSAYFKGAVDFAIMRTMDAMLALPALILPLILLAALGGGVLTVTLALGIAGVPGIARLMRAQALSQLEREYVLAARSLGASSPRIMLAHVAPNSLAPVIVAASLAMSFAVIAEAALSFLGVGVTPPTATWGTMLSTAYANFRRTPWLMFAPGGAIFLLVLSFNFIGDALRDLLDPRLRGAL